MGVRIFWTKDMSDRSHTIRDVHDVGWHAAELARGVWAREEVAKIWWEARHSLEHRPVDFCGLCSAVGSGIRKPPLVKSILNCESLPPGRVGPSHPQVSALGLIVLRPVRVADRGSWDALNERTPQEEVEQPPDKF